MSNVLLESCACGRPIITTDRPGCREIVEDGVNGFVVRQKDSADLIAKIEQFLTMQPSSRKQMGLAGRAKVEREFDRKIVIAKYLGELPHGL
jgi:galacturonosyltransferase